MKRPGTPPPSPRPVKKQRRVVPRRMKKSRVVQSVLGVPHSYIRHASAYSITGNPLWAPFLGVYQPQLNNLLNYSDFTNLYDQYRLDVVELKFYLKISPAAQSASTASYPRLFWYRDYNDAGTPTSLNEIRENQLCRDTNMDPNRPVVIRFKPNMLAQYYAGLGSSAYEPKFGVWADINTPGAAHYGIKYAIDDLTNTNYQVDVEVKYWFSMRQSR